MKRMKRWCSALLVLCLFFSLVPVHAEGVALTAMPETAKAVDGLHANGEALIAMEAELVETEHERISLLNNGATDYRQWSQGDSRWGSIRMGTSSPKRA